LLGKEAKASGVRFSAWVSRSTYLGLHNKGHIKSSHEIGHGGKSMSKWTISTLAKRRGNIVRRTAYCEVQVMAVTYLLSGQKERRKMVRRTAYCEVR